MRTLAMYRPNALQDLFERSGTLGDFDRYVESFFGDSILNPASRMLNQLPPVDIRETEKSYVLDMELPGYDEKDIDIHIDGSSLSIASKLEEAVDEKNKDAEGGGAWILRERRIKSFTRSFKLPDNADSEGVTAEFKNGILTLQINKRAEARKRAIQIKTK